MALKPFKAPGARLALRTKRESRRFSGGDRPAEVILDISRLLSRSSTASLLRQRAAVNARNWRTAASFSRP